MYCELTKSTTSYAAILFSGVKLLMFFVPNNWSILLILSIIEKSNSISRVGYLSAKLNKSEIVFQKTRYFFLINHLNVLKTNYFPYQVLYSC